MVLQMQSFGVGVLAGTDTGDPYVVPGFALHDEMESLVEAGLTPLQALNAATINPARYFNVDTSRGTIEKGKLASLVLLDADPLADIRNTRRIAAVIVNGRLLKRAELDALKAGRTVSAAAPVTKPQPRRSSPRRHKR
jgi:imidazolonepropionase-like amidohydrolase